MRGSMIIIVVLMISLCVVEIIGISMDLVKPLKFTALVGWICCLLWVINYGMNL